MADENDPMVESLQHLIATKSDQALRSLLTDFHPSDLAEAFQGLSEEEVLWVFSCLGPRMAADVLAEAGGEVLELLLARIPEGELAEILGEMEPDDAADVVGEIEDPERVKGILARMSELGRREVEGLLVHDEETAGGIMTSEFLAFPETWRVRNTIEFLRQAPPEIPFNNAYTLDSEGRLAGVFPIQRLVWSDPNRTLKEIAEGEVLSVTADMDQEEVAQLFAKYDLLALPVVDAEGRLTGRITVDDVLDVVQEEHTEDMFKMAGTSEDELVTRSARAVLALRFPWLLVALIGGGMCALLLRKFEGEIATHPYLAYYLPVIMAMGGNVGTQSSTLMVRGLATGQIQTSSLLPTIFREVRVGVLLGLSCGLLTGIFSGFLATLSGGPLAIGLIVALSMICSMTTATFFASLVPLTLSKLKVDPAVASGPFISVSNDVLGLAIYLTMTWSLHAYLID